MPLTGMLVSPNHDARSDIGICARYGQK